MIIYLHICRHVYLYITYTLPCQPFAYHDLFVENPQISARFDHAKAPGSGKAQDGDLRGHNLFVVKIGAWLTFSFSAWQEAAVAAADLQGQCTTE